MQTGQRIRESTLSAAADDIDTLHVHVSAPKDNRKLGAIPSVSLLPIITCAPGAKCAAQCYAAKMLRGFCGRGIGLSWARNTRIALTDTGRFFAELDAYVSRHAPEFFRFHVSGDIPTREYAQYMIRLARAHASTTFLCFTKRPEMLTGLSIPRNLTVLFSVWPGMPIPAAARRFGRAYVSHDKRTPANSRRCPGNCETCGMCWTIGRGESVNFKIH